jgi:outer membrane protein assembly factor BamB
VPGQEPAAPFAPISRDSVIQNVTSIVPPLRDFARTDRIVTFTPTEGVRVFSPGATEPVFSSRVLVEQPVGCAWLGGTNLLLWGGSRIALLKPEGGDAVWTGNLKSIAMVDVATADDSQAPNNNDNNDEGGVVINGQRIGGQVQMLGGGNRIVIVQNGQRILLRANGQMQVLPGQAGAAFALQANAVAVAGGPEQIFQVRIVADRAIISTTSGRLIALDLTDGKTLWQTRLGDRPIDRLLASDDFVVATINDGGALRLHVLDTFSGQSLGRKDFNNDGTGLLNLALSPDGKLVYVTADQLACKDLFDTGDLSKPTFTISTRKAEGNPLFMGSTQPEQLQISDGRVLAVSDNGQFVRAYSLETGKPLQPVAGKGNRPDVDGGLQTQSSDWRVQLLTVGPRAYVWSPKAVISYNLDNPADTWSWAPRQSSNWSHRDALAAKDYLVMIDEPANINPNARGRFLQARAAGAPNPPRIKFTAFSRSVTDSGRESGVLAHELDLSDNSGISAWQIVDGGFYYLTADRKLHFLKGAAAD